MNNNMALDMDPLSSYTDFPSYVNYDTIQMNQPIQESMISYEYVVKNEGNTMQSDVTRNKDSNTVIQNDVPATEQQGVPKESILTQNTNDTKPMKKSRVKKEKNSYWSEKINDNSFKFYGCALCNVSFSELQELDHHVTVHKGRLTSYDLRLKNRLKKKKLKKEQKRLKKKAKIKEELEIEIKPEDGYIGNEKASEFNRGENSKNVKVDNEVSKGVASENAKNGNTQEENAKNGNIQEDDTMDKLYKCFACQKQFALSYYLKLHVRSHTDEKPYVCSVCGQSFITASKLGRHNKRIHLAIRYQCRICYKFFTRFEYLTRHFDKKHAADKLDGEPYDFNAILPYLKELEQQLQQQKEDKDTKPKTEELFPKIENDVLPSIEPVEEDKDIKQNCEIFFDQKDILDNAVEEIDKPKIKIEVDGDCANIDDGNDHFDDGNDHCVDGNDHFDDGNDNRDDDVKDHIKNEDASDDDYFPSNTWAANPEVILKTGDSNFDDSISLGRRKKTDAPLQCKVCEKKIRSTSYMRIHMRTHTGEKPFKCHVCDRGFITSSKMHRHALTHSDTWDEVHMKSEEDIKKEKSEEKKDKDESLKKAKAKFTQRPRNSKEKPRNRRQKRPHACDYCQKRFLHLETLQVHKKSHEGEEKVLKCQFCLMEFDGEEDLKKHEGTHVGPKPYLCTLCGKTYKRRETMVYHRKHHKPEKRFVCDICSKSFTAQCKLQRHIISHRTDKFVLRYECPVCAHMFNTKYHMQMHLSTHQKEGLIQEENRNDILAMVMQNARKFPKQSDAPSNLSDLLPSDERSRICNICGEIFHHFYYLEEHLKSHGSKIALEHDATEEVKKHTCQICQKSFKLHYYLKLHSFTHTKEKPFICQQCGKGFITKGKLKRHLECHTGVKKFQCHICYKFFTRPSYLRVHVRTIHGNQDYNFRAAKELDLTGLYLNSNH